MTKNFREMLIARQTEANTVVCVGLDPLIEKIPFCLQAGGDLFRSRNNSEPWNAANAVGLWMKMIIDATREYVCCYKLQHAHYELIPGGIEVMKHLINYIQIKHTPILDFVDCKRGDIARTQGCYRQTHLEQENTMGMNITPYMGEECFSAVVDQNTRHKAIVTVCYTSNPTAKRFQEKLIRVDDETEAIKKHAVGGNMRVWEYIALLTHEWASRYEVLHNAGLVMAAAYERPNGSGTIYYDHLRRCREIVGNDLWFLIPGIGAQKGALKETIEHAYTGPGSIIISNSSAIIFSSQEEDFTSAAAEKAKAMRDECRLYISS